MRRHHPLFRCQRIPSLQGRVNCASARTVAPTGACALLVATAVAGLIGCTPIVERAPFAARADTLKAGDLLGPFDGVVLDGETDRPVPGATVSGSWAFERGVGLVGPAGARQVVLETSADGRYRIPALRDLPAGASTRIRRFTLIVYHRGHVAWRSDRRFPGTEPRRDFAQRGNRVRLEKWQAGYRHHRHLAFLGGGDAIRAASAWELQPASLELEGAAPGAAGTALVVAAPVSRTLDVSPLLSQDEVRGVTGYPGTFERSKLPDLPSTEFYDSLHYKATGKPESWDVALRAWLLGTAGAEAQYRKIAAELPGAKATDELGDASLRAKAGEVAALAFLQRERGIVVTVTCGIAQCPEPAMLLRLAKLIEGHLADLAAPPPPPGATPPGAPPPPAPANLPPGAKP